MAQFQINKYDHITRTTYTTQAADFNALMTMAKNGNLEPGDLIKPQGSKEWLYAGELPNIKDLLYEHPVEEVSKVPTIIGSLLLLASLGCGYIAVQNQQAIPSAEDLQLLGSNGLKESEALLTNTAKMYGDVEARQTLITLDKNEVVELVDKEGTMFKVKYNGKEGWLSIDDLVPLYLFSDDKVREQYQARFDPHRKINILNTSWARPEYGSDKTNISFKLQNLSPYPVNNIVVTVSIKDSSGAVQRKEIFNIKGTILEGDTSSVYTIKPKPRSEESALLVTLSELEKMEKADPSVSDRILDSIERSFDKGTVGSISMRVTQANAIVKKK